jgi:hypothetical protein
MNWLFRDPPRDPGLAAALRRLEDPVSLDDSTALQQQISAAARPGLAVLRSPSPHWWEWITRWTPIAVPVGVAAALAAALLIPGLEEAGSTGTYAVEAGADSTLVIAAFSEEAVGSQWTARLVAPETGDWLLEQAVVQ